MTLKQALAKLEALGNEKMRTQNLRHGSGDNQFGVRRGDVRKLAKEIKTDHGLALELWETGNIDARFLAVLLMKPAELTASEVTRMVKSEKFVEVADWFNNYVVKKHPDKEALRVKWMKMKDPLAARAGWTLTTERVSKKPEGLDLKGLLDRIEAEMADAHPTAQWWMNFALVQIGVDHEKHRKRAIKIGEKLGIYEDYKAPKGCTSPFAPVYINEMVSRQG